MFNGENLELIVFCLRMEALSLLKSTASFDNSLDV